MPLPASPPDQPPSTPTAFLSGAPVADDSSPYPLDMVKGDIQRQAFSEADEIRLRFDGWRRADEQPHQRGAFLPPPTTTPAAAPGEPGPASESKTRKPTR